MIINVPFDPCLAARALWLAGAKQFGTVLSDYDDCMAPTEAIALGKGALVLAIREFKNKGIPKFRYNEDEFVDIFPGLNFKQILTKIGKEDSLTFTESELERLAEEEVNAVIAAFNEHLMPMQFCENTLTMCRDLSIAFGVVSSSAYRRLEACLKKTGQDEFIPMDMVTSAQDPHVKRGKPHPDVWIYAMERWEKSVSQCVGIEDSPSGVKSCAAAGPPVIGLVQALTEEKRAKRRGALIEAGATIVLDSWKEISATLKILHAMAK